MEIKPNTQSSLKQVFIGTAIMVKKKTHIYAVTRDVVQYCLQTIRSMNSSPQAFTHQQTHNEH